MRDSTCAGNSPNNNPITVTVFDISQYFYCPRKVYYLRLLDVCPPARKKMELGREEQTREEGRLSERKTIYGFPREAVKDIVYRLYLEAPEIGLAGQIDSYLSMKNGELIPVDTKYTESVEVQRQYRKQIVAYAVLLDHVFGIKTKRGIIYFSKQKEAVEISISEEDKRYLLKDLEVIRKILTGERLPRKSLQEKCGYCEVKRFCV